MYYNGFGGFSKDRKKYIIKTNEKNTPAPWSHIIANRNFGTIVTVNGGGYVWSNNSRENKITTWSNDPVGDKPSEKIWIECGNKVLNVLPYENLIDYEIEFGFGYAKYKYAGNDVAVETTVIVPIDKNKKVLKVDVKNMTENELELKLNYLVIPVLGVSRDYTKKHLVINKDDDIVKISNAYRDFYQDEVIYLTMNEHFEMNEENKIVTLTANLKLNVNEKKTLFIEIGIDSSSTNCEDEKTFAVAMNNIENFWNNEVGKISVKTPIESMNIMLNGWLLYQTIVSRLWGRTSFYQAGGAFGFRDQLQDSLIMLYYEPEFTRRQILYHARHQFKEGDVLHWWHPEKSNGIRTRYTDDLLWLPYLICEYVEKENDFTILDEMIPYVKANVLSENENERYGEVEIDEASESLYIHAKRAINRSLFFADNGLPQMGTGDWNDGMNTVNGQSVWLGFFMYDVIKKFIKLCEFKNDEEVINEYKNVLIKLKEALNTVGWDGKWYRRAFFKDNTPLGSSENDECKMDGISQSWAVISGAGEHDKCVSGLDYLDNYLVDKENMVIKLLTPPFSNSLIEPGYIKSYIPGVRENGGQYTHGAIWSIIANALMENGERAGEYFRIINPIEHARTKEAVFKYKVEPYVVSADVYSNSNMQGRGGWTWYTGSSSWLFIAGFEYILGVRKKGEYLNVIPCIPKEWESYSVEYKYKDALYVINVYNPEHRSFGVKTIYLDNDEQTSNSIKLQKDGEHKIDIIM